MITAALLVLAFASLTQAVIPHPYELTAFQANDGACEVVGIRQTQLHKDLHTDEDVVIEKLLGKHSDLDENRTMLRLYGAKEEQVWKRLEIICTGWLSNEVQNDGSNPQRVFTQLNQVIKPKPLPVPPPLTITPLLVSGPSENRVDLVFFGDGCKMTPT